ncbi:YbxH family protein [Oceanobacillus senegalensis]|uniref:YbxH family protein n=1 Tax=Oceanobacillus senegalensis TaxID=1936063 RepID=UPI000A30DD29|nr:YbxH family protein [Oceanobacillus senegalensis]
MGAIERGGYRFEPEFSVIEQNGAIHVYNNGEFIDEVTFSFNGKFPELPQIEKLVDEYCEQHGIL